MVTAKTNGSSSPWTKRQASIAARLPERPIISVGVTSPQIAATISRLRPSMSETEPTSGAMIATAEVVAVMVSPAAAGGTAKLAAISGSTAWMEYMLRKVMTPASATPAVRRLAQGLSGVGSAACAAWVRIVARTP